MMIFLNDYALDDVRKIQEWYNEAFGFIPSRKQVVLFAAQSVKSVVAEVVIKHRLKYPGIGQIKITLPEKISNLLQEYVAETGDLFYSCSFLVECLIVFRAMALPEVNRARLEVKEIKKAPKVSYMRSIMNVIRDVQPVEELSLRQKPFGSKE